jgi:glycosyltransferase involved in cell wall biosynthesis
MKIGIVIILFVIVLVYLYQRMFKNARLSNIIYKYLYKHKYEDKYQTYFPLSEREREKGLKKMKSSRIVLTGLCRNGKDTIDKNIEFLLSTGEYFKDFRIVLFENDSTDDTRQRINEWVKKDSRIELIECEVPNCQYKKQREHGISRKRQDDMVFYRNKTLDYIKQKYSDYDYQMIVDLDMEGYYSLDGLIQSMSYDKWDAIFVNGLKPCLLFLGLVPQMYDSLAFVSTNEDIMERYQTISDYFQVSVSLFEMQTMKENKLYKVKSAFNGVGLYKMSSIKDCHYPNDWSCEHIGFHHQMIENGFDRLYVNPNWIAIME